MGNLWADAYKNYHASQTPEEEPKYFKVIIAGGRDFCMDEKGNMLPPTDMRVMDAFLKIAKMLQKYEHVEIVSGKAKGADTIGEWFAGMNTNQIKVKGFPADWDKYGRGAGPIRNREMAKYADALIAFWDGKSKGTENMIETARNLGLKVKVYHYEHE